MDELPWPPGTATGVGSMPGDDPYEALRVVTGELPDLPYLPELPARGPWAQLTGRTAALLVDLPVDLQPSGWRLVDRAGMDLRRARDLLARDLDALQQVAGGGSGPLKVQAAGPWTLAATLELGRGGPALADPAAVRDLADSLQEGLSAHLADVAGRLPGRPLVLQLDEPALPGVLAGDVPTASGFGRVGPVDPTLARDRLAGPLTGPPAAFRLAHCCAGGPPPAALDVLRTAGAQGLSLPLRATARPRVDAAPDSAVDEALGAAVEAGVVLFLGTASATADPAPEAEAVAAPARALWRRLGMEPATLPRAVVLTPDCGLAGASPDRARRLLQRCGQAARQLADDPEAPAGRERA